MTSVHIYDPQRIRRRSMAFVPGTWRDTLTGAAMALALVGVSFLIVMVGA